MLYEVITLSPVTAFLLVVLFASVVYFTRYVSLVITSYSIHYTKLYDDLMSFVDSSLFECRISVLK